MTNCLTSFYCGADEVRVRARSTFSAEDFRTCYEDNILATGFGGHLALPILRKKWRPDLEEGEAR